MEAFHATRLSRGCVVTYSAEWQIKHCALARSALSPGINRVVSGGSSILRPANAEFATRVRIAAICLTRMNVNAFDDVAHVASRVPERFCGLRLADSIRGLHLQFERSCFG